jgi:hypothetical protein
MVMSRNFGALAAILGAGPKRSPEKWRQEQRKKGFVPYLLPRYCGIPPGYTAQSGCGKYGFFALLVTKKMLTKAVLWFWE